MHKPTQNLRILVVLLMTVSSTFAFTLHTSARVEIVPQLEIESFLSTSSAVSVGTPRERPETLAFRLAGPEDLCVNVSFGEFSEQDIESGTPGMRSAVHQRSHDSKGELILQYSPTGADPADPHAGGHTVLFLEYE